jgi:hypothetical protein
VSAERPGSESGKRWDLQRAATASVLCGLGLLAVVLIVLDVRQAGLGSGGWPRWALAAGLVLLVSGLVAKAPQIVAALGGRRTRVGANVAVMTALAVLLTLLALGISERRFVRVDLTGTGRFTLSATTERVLARLSAPVRVTVLYNAKDPNGAVMGPVVDLLAAYRSASRRIRLERFDPLDPDNKRALEELSFRLKGAELYANCVVFESGGRHKVVEASRLVEAGRGVRGGAAFGGEDVFTAAILSVVEGKERVVRYLTGHGERPISGRKEEVGGGADPLDSAAFSLGELARKLAQENYRLEPLDLVKAGEVPPCAALVIAGARAPLQPGELEALGRYLEGGGRLLVLADSTLVTRGSTNIGALLKPWGIAVHPDVIGCFRLGMKMGEKTVGGVVRQVPIATMADHPVTADLRRFRIDMLSPCALEVLKRPGLRVTALATGMEGTWGETIVESPGFDAAKDLAGPVVVGAAAEGGGARIVVFASSVGFTDYALERSPQAAWLAVNAVNWLAGRETRLGIAPKRFDMRRSAVGPGTARFVPWLMVVMVPLAIIVAGLAVWQVRRQR